MIEVEKQSDSIMLQLKQQNDRYHVEKNQFDRAFNMIEKNTVMCYQILSNEDFDSIMLSTT